MYVQKVRDLSRILGEANNLLYYATSSNLYTPSVVPYFKDKDYWLSIYNTNKAKAATLSTCPAYLGKEDLYSNQHGKGHMNNCLHTKSRLLNLPYLSLHSEYNFYNVGYLEPYFRQLTPNVVPYQLIDIAHLGTADSTVRGRAWWNMQPRFQSGVSMQNFLFELKDFRDIGGSLKNMKELASTIGNTMIEARAAAKKGHTKRLVTLTTGSVAEATLLNSFAIQPMIKDAMEIALASCQLADQAQQQFHNLGLISQKSHYTENVSYVDETVPGNYNAKWLKYGLVKRTDFTATLRYKYAYSLRNSRDAFLKYWGFSSSFEALWNMLPFTFLADYIFTVAKSIRAMERDPNVEIQPTEYCETLKTLYNYGHMTSGDPIHHLLVLDGVFLSAANGSLTKDTLISGAQGSKYDRRVCEPYKGPALPKFKKPSTKQLLNTLALVRCFLD